MRGIIPAVVTAAIALGIAGAAARAHAFLDHADPRVGSTVSTPPAAVTLWFTEDIEPAFSRVSVINQTGLRVDLGNVQVPPGHPDQLQVGLQKLPPGSYRVNWRVVSVDAHATEGGFEFRVEH